MNKNKKLDYAHGKFVVEYNHRTNQPIIDTINKDTVICKFRRLKNNGTLSNNTIKAIEKCETLSFRQIRANRDNYEDNDLIEEDISTNYSLEDNEEVNKFLSENC